LLAAITIDVDEVIFRSVPCTLACVLQLIT